MSWTRTADLRAQLQKTWERGEMLAELVTGTSTFPRRLILKVPTSAEMTDRFDEVRVWIAEIMALSRYRVVMREFKHRVFGANAVPHEVWIDSIGDALALLGKQRAAACFSGLIEMTRRQRPLLLDWLAARPLRALELGDEWSRLLEIVSWRERHSRPGVYLRQVDIPGVHSKFIEAHRGVLSELLDIVLPRAEIDFSARGVGRFAQRYGFLDKLIRIRIRVLDPGHALLPCATAQDITLDADSFARLDLRVSRVFITENEINFLAFPQVKDSMIIFGAGYGFDMLRTAGWLSRRRIHYWGDIDTHGFAILDQLRSLFDQVESFLMDRVTFLKFESQWGAENKPTFRDLPRLTAEERALYDDLRDNRLGKNLRLEQERIGFGWVESAIVALGEKEIVKPC
jgi:hypothetical protein